MRRIRQQLSQDECVDILCQSTSGVLAVMGDGGYPYAVPLSHVYADGHVYFHSALQGHKIDAIGNESAQPDVYYNLQGQRVDNPGKGVYIRNGKKVIIK